MFFDRLTKRIQDTGTRFCIGIDPQKEKHQSFSIIEQKVETLVNLAAEEDVPAVKFQSAYFEACGIPGLELLKRSLEQCRRNGVLTILDAKRGDISSTMQAYGEAAFDYFDCDCLTITPYMGIDTVEPLVPWLKAGRGIYVVWLTSNKSADALQLVGKSGEFLVTRVRCVIDSFANERALTGAIGYVLGATKLSDALVRNLVDDMSPAAYLLPGVGAQGAVVDDSMKTFFSVNPASLVPMSREIGGHKFESRSAYESTAREKILRFKADF